MSQTHLYNSKLGKFRWFIQRFGAKELFLKPLRIIFAPLILPSLPAKSFRFKGEDLPLFYHRYNMTWASERCIEVPIARYFASLFPSDRILEVGNVLSHYGPVSHEILDKFERGPGVINEDIITFRPKKTYDLVLSISTFEHIGFDDELSGRSAEKILAAVQTCRQLLSPSGKLVLTVPVGYNPVLDELIISGRLGATTETFFKKFGPQDWRQTPKEEAMGCRYKEPYAYANAVLIAEWGG